MLGSTAVKKRVKSVLSYTSPSIYLFTSFVLLTNIFRAYDMAGDEVA